MSANTDAVNVARSRWNAGDLEGYLQLYDPSVRLHGYAPQPMGKDEVGAFYRGIWDAFPGPQLAFHEVFESGDRVVIRFTMSGTHRGDFMGVPPTGRDVAVDGITILQMRDGRCIERWSSADMLGWLQQIGAVPAPA